ncbi:hypothetical protein XA68_12437 [Ophiocordyceps unilateralis]|uniref:Uncharacterized protein n=1 Tax=Ophiocordyceps unilateralis TaxID=268505 RepID=A0A2A9PEU2_OPHUN|nr:hypothetical protein XA68_12437 [Ophiocordyceps unilateralis]
MLEAGSNPRVRNKGGLTPVQLIDPDNAELRDVVMKHDFATQNAGDFVTLDQEAELSGSDEEDRAEWERLRKGKSRNG